MSTTLFTHQFAYSILLVIFATCILGLTWLVKHVLHTFYGPLSKVPGPRWRAFSTLPHIRSTWTGDEPTTVDALHKRYGPVVRLAPDLVSFIGDAQTWKQIYVTKRQGVCAFPKDLMFYDPPYNQTGGPVSAADAESLTMRKSMAPAFSDQGLKQYEIRFKAWCATLQRSLDSHAREKTTVDMVKMFNFTTFDIMSDLLMSEPLQMLEKQDYVPWVRLIFTVLRHMTRLKALRYINRTLGSKAHNLLMSIPSLRQHAENHHRFIVDRVDDRLAKQPKQPDVWSLITSGSTTAELISQEERYSIASELMIAGTETTATLLSGLFFYLLRNPQWLKSLATSLRTQFSTSSEIDMSSLQSHTLLNAILKEGMRMYPPAPIGFPRFVPEGGAEIRGYYMPRGTRVAIYHLATYRDEKLWREPYAFRPERWMGDEKFADDHSAAFEPFSTGLRGCVGKNFAWHEMRLILATILIDFDFELRPGQDEWADQKTFIVWEKDPLWVSVKRRDDTEAKEA